MPIFEGDRPTKCDKPSALNSCRRCLRSGNASGQKRPEPDERARSAALVSWRFLECMPTNLPYIHPQSLCPAGRPSAQACCLSSSDEDRHIKRAVQHRLARGYASHGSIFSRYTGLGCAKSVQLLLRLQQAILQPCASYACEVWALASACIGPCRDLQQLQRTFLRRACRVKKSIPVDVIFQELQQIRWHDFWWRSVSSFWSALVEADTGALHSIIFQDAIQLALAGCKFSWAAQVLQCFSALGESLPLVAEAPIAIEINLLQELFLRDRLASFDSLPQDPRLAPSAGVKLCTYHCWFGRPQNAACPSYWESPLGNARLHRILRFRMGSHHLPVEKGRHFNLPRASRVCNLCNTGALGDERHMLLECPALADPRLQFSSVFLSCSSVMRRLLWAKDQHEVCRYIIACLDRMSSH